jgi:hypothetical protein
VAQAFHAGICRGAAFPISYYDKKLKQALISHYGTKALPGLITRFGGKTKSLARRQWGVPGGRAIPGGSHLRPVAL